MNTFTTKIYNPKQTLKCVKRYHAFRESMFHAKSDSFLLKQDIQKLQEFYADIALPLIPKIFKEYLSLKPVSVEKIKTKSTFHILFLVNTLNNAYVLKINIMEEYNDFSFVLESTIQRNLSQKSIPSVNVLCVDISRENYPFDFMIMPYINGKNVELFAYRNAKNFYKEKGSLLKKIHSFTSKKAGTIDFVNLLQSGGLAGTNSSWDDFFTSNLKNHIKQATQINVIDEKQGKYLLQLFTRTKHFYRSGTYSLLHNDPSVRNLKVANKHIVAIFDWEDAIFGDPMWEIAFVHTFLFREEDKGKFEAFCDGYGIESNELMQDLTYWMYYVRVALLKTINRHSMGYYNTMGFEIDKKRMQYALKNIKNL